MDSFSKVNLAVKHANEKGYKILSSGPVMSPFGKLLKMKISSNGYAVFSVRYKGDSFPVLVHRLCAYQKYGDVIFSCDCVRHLDGNRLNNAHENIEIGSFSDNQMDKPKNIRVMSAKKASHSYSMKYNDEDVCRIKDYHSKYGGYNNTMKKFGISSKGTLHFILNKR